MSQKSYIEDRFGDGECGAFAQALHEITGLPLVLFALQRVEGYLPKGFPRHAAVQVDEDLFLDAFGPASAAEITARFGVPLYRIDNPHPDMYPFESGPGGNLHDASEFAEALHYADLLLSVHDLGHLARRAPPMGRGSP